MDSVQAQVIVSLSGHWLVGTLRSNGKRIQDILRDKNRGFITLTDVQICRPTEGEWCRAALPEVIVPQQEIEFVIAPQDRHEAPINRYNNYAVRETTNCLVIVRQFCIQGEVHVPVVHDDTAHTFLNQLGSFFPITNVCLNTTGIEQLTAPVLFVNKEHVSCFYVGPLMSAEAPASDQVSESSSTEIESGIDALLKLIDSFKNDAREAFSEEPHRPGVACRVSDRDSPSDSTPLTGTPRR